MATGTGSGESAELVVSVTLLAGNSCVAAGKREIGFVVIKGHIVPFGGAVTGGAIGAEFAVVCIVFLVAGEAIGGRALVGVVHVAFFTADVDMCAFEFEGGKVVVELGGFPAIGGVAGGAIGAEAAMMRFVLAVAGVAVDGEVGEIGKCAGVGMTGGA